MTDPVRLGQVIINLLSNAIRFTDKAASHRREIKIRIQVSARPPVDESCICPPTSGPILPGEPCWIYGAVEDSGPGLAPEELSMLFRRFSQASSATHTVFGGSGLGLYVCRSKFTSPSASLDQPAHDLSSCFVPPSDHRAHEWSNRG
jgi:signal transduction histidine kinase